MPLPQRPPGIVFIVVASTAFIAVIYMLTLAICSVRGTTPPDAVLSSMEKVALVALGSLVTFLARTSTGGDPGSPGEPPMQTEVVNSRDSPVIVAESDKRV